MTPAMTIGTGVMTRTAGTLDHMGIRRTLAVLVAGLLTATAVGVTHGSGAVDALYPAPRSLSLSPPTAAPAGDLPTVAILLGPAGANAADALAPYETLAVSGRYRVVTVAETRDPVPLTGGLEVIPDHTFADLGRADWIVVPAVQETGAPRLQSSVDWLRQRHADGARLMSVCAGAGLLARTGLLDGRPATSNWLALYGLERRYPDTDWKRGTRYVDDGRIITTAGVLSGVDGALRILEREQGAEVARQAADAVHWTTYHPGGSAPIEASHPAPADAVALLNVGFRNPVEAGVLLTPGVGEIELASVFRTYTEMSFTARLTAVTADGQPIRSRHGLTFVPRGSTVTGYDRLIVPGREAAVVRTVDPALKPVYVHDRPEFAFESTLRDLAATTDVATARWVAKSLEYRAGDLSGPVFPWWPALLLLLVAAAGGVAYHFARAGLARRPGLGHWLRHLTEMIVAMVAGMILLAPLWGHLGHTTLVMAFDMAAGMAIWMAIRGHDKRMIGEMALVMVAPFVALLPWLTGSALSVTGHVLMLAAMVVLMAVRWRHYSAAPTWLWTRRRARINRLST